MRSKPESAGTRAEGLSIVFLHYNRPWSLEIAVRSLDKIRCRCGFPTEVILADDGSDAELLSFFDRLPCDQITIQSKHLSEDRQSTVYNTLLAGYQAAKYDHLLYVEDDFWFIPQGFPDRGKSHLEGLLARPNFGAQDHAIQGGVELLQDDPEAHFVELARSYSNPRYPSVPSSEHTWEGIRFRAKQHTKDNHWYICAWPHIMRTREALAISLPLGAPLWSGELKLSQIRRKVYGSGNWVYNPERCYFVHMNIFTWREAIKNESQADAEGNMRWMGTNAGRSLPFQFTAVPNFNYRLLEAFKNGRIRNDLDEYFSSSPAAYAYHRYYKRILDDL